MRSMTKNVVIFLEYRLVGKMFMFVWLYFVHWYDRFPCLFVFFSFVILRWMWMFICLFVFILYCVRAYLPWLLLFPSRSSWQAHETHANTNKK